MKFTDKRQWLALAAIVLPCVAHAAGLGKLTVLSKLGQPLKAEVEIVSLQKGEGDSLSARLASSEAFRQANIAMSGALFSVKFNIERRGEDKYVLVLSSTQPINEPFMDMLVELDWSGGRLIREYTFLLDPPEYTAPGTTVATPQVSPVEVPSTPQAQALPAPAPREAAPAAPQAGAPAPAPKAAGRYEVKRGDTLTKIARANAIEGISVQQMLVALFRANPDAFIGNNMNRLRAGRILTLPDRTAAMAVSEDDARRIVVAQNADYAEYRERLAAAVAAAPARPGAPGRQAAGKIATGPQEKPAPPKTPARDQLRLSRAADEGKGGRAAQAALADDLAAKEKALQEANERIAMLEKNVQELQKMIELKSGAGAQLQQQAQQQAQGAPSPPAAPKASEAAKVQPPSSAPAPGAGAPKAAPQAAQAPKAKAPVAKAPAPPEPSLMDELLDNLYLAGGVIVVALLLIGYGVFRWRKKREEQLAAAVPSSPLESSSVLGTAGGRSVDTGSSALQSDFSQSNIGKTDVEEVDPIAEADVYMAYGRDAQAEEVLKEALAKDPSRQAIRLKLLEIYAKRNDRQTFEATAREIHAASGGRGADWEKAVALGLALDPDNPLYGGAKEQRSLETTQVVAGAAPLAAPTTQPQIEPGAPLDLDFDLGRATQPPPDISLEAAAQPEDSAAGAHLDFDLGLSAPAGSTAPPAAEAPAAEAKAQTGDLGADLGSIDFTLPAIEPTLAAAPEAAAPAPQPTAPAVALEGGLDFDLGAAAPAAQPSSAAAELDLSALSLDLGPAAGSEPKPAAVPDPRWQEVATKLDLAKAYQDMGDKEGARELLKEVIKEGDSAQQQQAQSMLLALG